MRLYRLYILNPRLNLKLSIHLKCSQLMYYYYFVISLTMRAASSQYITSLSKVMVNFPVTFRMTCECV